MYGLAILFIFGSLIQILLAQEQLTDTCIKCICGAITNCNQNLGCENDVCGAFRITQMYWLDAGQPVIGTDDPQSDESFARCATDQACAEITVRNYLTKYITDCNGDGVIDCYDYAKLHRFGPSNCTNTVEELYKNLIIDCMSSG
ncbi:lysozyme-like [Lycorma delicatula]|uniref:lysozyme-like n=1 Tax=Lycorma delicatula TaxID=130591 RepID=UPI003F50ED17